MTAAANDVLASLDLHPLTRAWFAGRFGQPTRPQALGWPAIQSGEDVLIAAPTGSGKTLSAFFIAIDELVRSALAGTLGEELRVLYISPLKALSNDIQRNLAGPLDEIQALATQQGLSLPPIRALVRTGDTPASERQAMLRHPPHILVTTPESVFIMLTSPKARELFATVNTAIVDEIHALARDKRGAHLSLTLERLDYYLRSLGRPPPRRLGLSATQRPIEMIADFLVGAGRRDAQGQPRCRIVDAGHARDLDLALTLPPSELSAVCSHELWGEVYQELKQLITSHRSTIVFVNTRRLAERVAHNLREELGEDAVASHHGSLSRELRLDAEQRLKRGELKAIVATASLELGIDVGYLDLVCQIGSPRSIATFLQRIGRSGHSLGKTPKGRLLPLSRDELLECMALLRAIEHGHLDRIIPPLAPLDILAQQVVAMVAVEDWAEDDLYEICRRAWSFSTLTRPDFEAVVRMLSDGVDARRQTGAYLHRDALERRLKARRSARLAAVTSGGAIPEPNEYRVVNQDDGAFLGMVSEDFAIESARGDVFLLGNSSWRVLFVRSGEMAVTDAQGAPANIPFWFGEAPARTDELSRELSALRGELADEVRLAVLRPTPGPEDARLSAYLQSPAAAALAQRLSASGSVPPSAAWQALRYVAAQVLATGVVPTHDEVLFERFFDEAGGMQLVIHSPWGARINRAWGIALRKRFCRSFDFELQASADDNGIVLSLGPQHSFPLDSVYQMVNPESADYLLTQALLAQPMFQVRWRWNASRSLAVLRFSGGKKVPPHLQRFRADDLLTAVFPQCTACLENIEGDIEIPDHPLVKQTMRDCKEEATDLAALVAMLAEQRAGKLSFVARDTREPSPFSHALINAMPYAFLDGAPLEERRVRAVATRRGLDDLGDLSWLDPEVIAEIREEAWPEPRDAEELREALIGLVAVPASRVPAWALGLVELRGAGRAGTVTLPSGAVLWVSAERQALAAALWPELPVSPQVPLPEELAKPWERRAALVELLRGWLEASGPLRAEELAASLGLAADFVLGGLEHLEGEGFVMRGSFTVARAEGLKVLEWCERRLLARIHQRTLNGLRQRLRPVPPAIYCSYLFALHGLASDAHVPGPEGVRGIIGQLQGVEVPLAAWESEVLPARLGAYLGGWLDQLTLGGELLWGRLAPPAGTQATAWATNFSMHRGVAIAIVAREDLGWLLPASALTPPAFRLHSDAARVHELLGQRGACFMAELRALAGLLPEPLEKAIGQLLALGLAHADSFAAARQFSQPKLKTGYRFSPERAARHKALTVQAGRWAKFPGPVTLAEPEARITAWAWQLLRRYGVVCRDFARREDLAPPWRELARCYRRLEARGEIRGGRFLSGVGGEQFALPGAVEQLRHLREQENRAEPQVVVLSAVDPANLSAIFWPERKAGPQTANRLAWYNGVPVACQEKDLVQWFEEVPEAARAVLAKGLQRGPTGWRVLSPAKQHEAAAREAALSAEAQLELPLG